MAVASTITPADIREAIAVALDEQLSPDGWSRAAVPLSRYGRTSHEIDHRGYAIGTPRSSVLQDRQRRHHGVLLETQVEVRWSYHLTLDEVHDAEAEADRWEQRIVAAIMGSSRLVPMRPRLVRLDRTLLSDRPVRVGDIRLSVHHYYSLD